jgi:hypothetical protein
MAFEVIQLSTIYGKRSLLNLPGYESVGAIVAEVYESDTGWVTKLNISDCHRTITLEFGGPSSHAKHQENDLYKIDTLIECLTEFRKGYMKADKIAKKRLAINA